MALSIYLLAIVLAIASDTKGNRVVRSSGAAGGNGWQNGGSSHGFPSNVARSNAWGGYGNSLSRISNEYDGASSGWGASSQRAFGGQRYGGDNSGWGKSGYSDELPRNGITGSIWSRIGGGNKFRSSSSWGDAGESSNNEWQASW